MPTALASAATSMTLRSSVHDAQRLSDFCIGKSATGRDPSAGMRPNDSAAPLSARPPESVKHERPAGAVRERFVAQCRQHSAETGNECIRGRHMHDGSIRLGTRSALAGAKLKFPAMNLVVVALFPPTTATWIG